MRKIEHLGIAVKSIEESNNLFERLLGVAPYKEELVEKEQVKTSFFRVGNNKIELVQSLHSDGVISRFIEKKGEGIHHVAFDVPDIKAEMSRLKEQGFKLLSEEPFKGADNKLVCFVHPKTAGGILVELCQNID